MAAQSTRVIATRARARPTPAPVRALAVYALFSGQRPVSGERMYAHTQAALVVLGITARRGAPMPALQHLIGDRAFTYHLARLQNICVRDGLVYLTKTGADFFASRMISGKTSVELVEAFANVFTTGKPNKVAQVEAHQINATPYV